MMCHVAVMENSHKKVQCFLISSAARKISIRDIWKMNNQEATDIMARLRCANTNGALVCP